MYQFIWTNIADEASWWIEINLEALRMWAQEAAYWSSGGGLLSICPDLHNVGLRSSLIGREFCWPRSPAGGTSQGKEQWWAGSWNRAFYWLLRSANTRRTNLNVLLHVFNIFSDTFIDSAPSKRNFYFEKLKTMYPIVWSIGIKMLNVSLFLTNFLRCHNST